jgi:outer membrane protein assembly factor BamA
VIKYLLIFFSFFFLTNTFGKNLADSLVYINQLSISGNERTKAPIVLREMTIQAGDSLTTDELSSRLAQSKINLINTRLFMEVEFLTSQNKEKSIDIQIVLKERWYIFAIPVVFLADRSFNEWWYNRNHDFRRLTYGVQAKHFNLSGNNDQLSIKAFAGFVPYVEVTYSRPYIDKRHRLGLRVGTFYSTQRSIAFRTWNDKLDFLPTEERSLLRRGAFAELRFRKTFYHTHSLYLGFSASQISDTISVLNPTYFFGGKNRQQLLTLTYDYVYDKRDNRQYPLRGAFFYVQQAGYFSLLTRETPLLASFVRLDNYFALTQKLFAEVSARSKFSFPQRQPYSLQRGLGYLTNYVGGYDLYVVDGQHYGLLKTNLKYEFFKKTTNLSKFVKIKQFNSLPLALYATSFLDAGFVKNYYPELNNTALGNRFLLGGGIGVDAVTWYDTVIKMNYSVNMEGQKQFFFTIVRNL